MHLDLGAHEVGTRRVGRNLQPAAVPGDGIVGGNGALVLDAQDIAPLGFCDGHKGRSRFGGLDRETGVVAGNVGLLQEAVGGGDVADLRQPEFLGQAVLQGAEHAFRTPARLRRIGRNMLDAELSQGASDLGEGVLGNLAAGLRGVEIMAAAVGIERAEQPLRGLSGILCAGP